MSAEQKAGLKPSHVYTLMRVSWGEGGIEQQTSESVEAVGVEKGSMCVHFYPLERCVHFKDVCLAAVCLMHRDVKLAAVS